MDELRALCERLGRPTPIVAKIETRPAVDEFDAISARTPVASVSEFVNSLVQAEERGNPVADVLFGVDNTLLSRALGGDLFLPYVSPAMGLVPAEFVADGGLIAGYPPPGLG